MLIPEPKPTGYGDGDVFVGDMVLYEGKIQASGMFLLAYRS